MMNNAYSYEIAPRAADLGGGWRLKLLESGEEVGGGVFPPVSDIEDAAQALQAAHDDAVAIASEWVATKKGLRCSGAS